MDGRLTPTPPKPHRGSPKVKRYGAVTLLRSVRLPFLILTPISIFLGYAVSVASPADINPIDLVLVFLGAVAAHASVNTFNEYFDFRSGLDATTSKTPFSGGSGALVDNPEAASMVLCLAIVMLATTIAIGLYFVLERGLLLLPIGMLGVLIVLTYTPWLNRHPILCLVAPGTGFGPLMVIGTQVALTGEYTTSAFLASLVPFFLANNLLLLNQYPDIAADKGVGRRHVPIAYGLGFSSFLYGVFAASAIIVILGSVWSGVLPKASYFALAPMVLAAVVLYGATEHAKSTLKLVPYMAMNVVVAIVTPVILAASILLG